MTLQPPAPVDCALETIGNTPVVRLRRVVPDGCADIFVKLESFNPTGCYKDRMAKSMIEEAEKRGDLKPGMTVVEATGGSTGSSLSLVCAVKGYTFLVATSDAFSFEKRRTMTTFGATLHITPSEGGKVTPDLIPTMMKYAEAATQEESHYFTNQFYNGDSIVGYEDIGHELVKQLPDGIDAFCGSIGTGGMVMGVSRVLKSKGFKTRIVVLEPASAPLITQGVKGPHSVEGIGIGFIPGHLEQHLYDEARAIEEGEARVMCRRLAREEGLLVGTSSGLNVVAAIQLAKELGPGKTVVTVASDTGLKYLNGTLFADS
ncbi:hypothetical protein N7509_004496 [Penicillium cosmopolitanum]|uniref:Tryptophan synthase beta chain-like PALP domain-containing protein n=1 Tax=Penicillium cosmopolitanum TaxID=1131564 RepID=A0A9W9W701_9EURO|nr:uncharacterized protein N7509_004496 [Penicillium cosmopolitanum]KAJ5404625.1 hypothetical protein N7509_004496 [Penicillium cosmopolitanum]